MKKRILSLLLAFLMLFSMFPAYSTYAVETEKEVSVWYFNSVSEIMQEADTVELYRGGELYLSAILRDDISGDIQWQIEANQDFWVDIQGGTAEDLRISYGMVQSLLKDDTVRMRCIVSDNEEYCSDPFTVMVTDVDNRLAASSYVLDRTPIAPDPLPAPVGVPNETEPIADDEAEPEVAEETEPAATEETEPAATEETEPETTEETEPAATEETEPAATEETEPVVTEETEPAATEETEPAATEGTEPAATEETEPASTEETEPAATEETEPAATEETEPAATEETEPVVTEKTEPVTAEKTEPVVTEEMVSIVDNAVPLASASTPRIMLLSAVNTTSTNTENEDVTYYTVIIEYVYGDSSKFAGQRVALPYIAEVASGEALNETVASPSCVGYLPNISSRNLADLKEITADENLTVFYSPAEVSYTVRHYQQNVDNDEYTLVDTTVATGLTEQLTSEAAKVAGKNPVKDYTGFQALEHYSEEIAADGSTMIDIYYDRVYNLMSFELNGGHGVEPIYARYGAAIQVNDPIKAGYTFNGWTDKDGAAVEIPKTMPNESITYYADWTAQNSQYSIAYWVKNDDGTNTFLGTEVKAATAGTLVSGPYNLSNAYVCGAAGHAHTAVCCSLGLEEHIHTTGCFSGITFGSSITNNMDMNAILKANENAGDTEGAYLYFINTSGNTYWPKMLVDGTYWNVDINGSGSTTNLGKIVTGTHDAEGTVNGYTAYRYPVSQLLDSFVICGSAEHTHNDFCLTCEAASHIHTDDCKSDISQYMEYVSDDTDENGVTVAGDGSTVVNAYYKYKTYTIRFVYARLNSSGSYEIANNTGAGGFANCSWTTIIADNMPTFTDPSGATARSSFVHTDGHTYYYISLTAKYGADISALWPEANIGDIGTYYKWGSWAAAPGTGYREKYGDAHANIVGVYPTMSADMIVEDPVLLETREDGTKIYLAQNMIAWWATSANSGVSNHAYHNYFEVIGDHQDDDKEYNGKYYRLEETIIFTAAHNGTTRVDPIGYNGFVCINDTRGTGNDKQANSLNYANNDDCDICGDSCHYCNDFYYGRNVHSLKFYNHNRFLTSGDGVSVAYGTALAIYESGTDANKGATELASEQYPEGLEKNAYEFEGWYTTAECYADTEVNWETLTMPDSDLTLYANWVPVSHKVKIYRTEALSEQIGDTQTVTHNNYATEPDKTTLTHPTDTSATFIGWFYKDANKVEQAFSFASTPIKGDMTIYAKWRSNVMKEVEIYYVTDDGTQVAETETLMMRLGQTRTFEAKTGNSLYEDYRTGCFPSVASHSITIEDSDIDSSEPVTYTFVYKEYGAVPYQVEFYVLDENDVERPAFKKNAEGKAEFVEYGQWSNDYAAYIEQHWQNDKAVVTELYVPDDLAVSTWTLPDEYLPNALKIQKVIVPSETNPETNIGANTIKFVYTYTKPDDPDNPVYEARYLVQHFIESSSEDGVYSLYSYSDQIGLSGDTATAIPISIPGYTYSQSVTYSNKGNNTLEGDVLSGTISAKDDLELNFYYTVNSYPYQVMYLEEGTNRVLADAKTEVDGKKLTGLYGSKVTESAIDLNGDKVDEYDVVGASTKSIYIQMEAGNTASVNTIVFYYKLKSAELVLSKEVKLDEEQAAQEGISEIPSWVYDQEFVFTVYQPEGYPKSVYHYTITYKDGTTEDKTVNAGVQTIEVSLKHGESIQFHDFPMGTYTVTETYVPGFRTSVDGYIAQAHTVTLDADGDVGTLHFLNTFPFYTGDLVIKKNVTKLDERDPSATEPYKVTVVLNPDDSSREVDRVITFVDKDGNALTDASNNTSFTIPKLTGTDGQTQFTITLLVPVGGEVKMEGVPVGSFTAEEEVKGTIGYIYDFYTVKYNRAVHENDEVTGTNHVVSGSIHGGHPTAVTFTNTYKKGSLTIQKTVTQEYEKDSWESDTFTFRITGTTELPDGPYTVEGATVTVSNGTVTVKDASGNDPTITVTRTGDATSWNGSLTFTNLPAGYYTVNEISSTNGLDKYTTVSPAANLLVNDTVNATEAKFTNTYKRHYLDLTITTTCADDNQSFIFDVSATGTALGDIHLTVVLVGNDSQTIRDLPVGEYTVTEQTDWSWREAYVTSKTVELRTKSVTVSFDFGVIDRIYWLNGYSYDIRKKGDD